MRLTTTLDQGEGVLEVCPLITVSDVIRLQTTPPSQLVDT